MSLVRVVGSALSCVLLIACGERAGDPIVTLPSSPAPSGGDGGGGGGDANAGGGNPAGAAGDEGRAGAQPADVEGPVGLCGTCSGSDECGDANDACIRHQDDHFCGRDCDEQGGCPDGYACVQLDNSPLLQCVPQNGCAEPAVSPPSLDDVRRYLLARLNTERVDYARQPLQASSCLDDLGQASAVDFARTDEPLGKYVKECDPIWPNCECGWIAEAEISIARYGLDWMTAIDVAVTRGQNSQSDRFSQTFLSADLTDVGIGFWISGDEAWIALSFR